MQHVYFLARNVLFSSAVTSSYVKNPLPIVYRGISHTVEDSNILALKVLKGNPSTYSTSPNKPVGDGPESAGDASVLVSAVQARNNARVTISGSIEMYSNAFYHVEGMEVGNAAFCEDLTKWTFGEKAVLRFRDIVHHRIDGTPPDVILHEKERPDLPLSLYPDPEITRNSLVYRIKDEIVYSMVVEQYTDNQWSPFCASDMQMEFVMLDPHIRKTMTCNPLTGKYEAVFTSPDNYGIFKFRVLYRRPGYSVLHAETQVSIRPFKHNEYERFIFSAYPYYSSALSATIAFFVFSLFFLFSSDSK